MTTLKNKTETDSMDTFQNRLKDVLKSKRKKWWNEKLGVSNSLISSRWEKGTSPKADNIIKICQLSGVSPNWLLLGIGPKYIDNKSIDQNDETQRRELQSYIFSLEKKKQDLETIIENLTEKEKAIKSIVQIAKLFITGDLDQSLEQSFDKLDNLTGAELFNDYVMPLGLFFRSLCDISMKLFEFISKSEHGKSFLIEAFKQMKQEHGKNLLLFQSRLMELEPLFEADELEDLFHQSNK